MASKGEVGIDIDVARVPLREADMEPFEIMVSESQERMLCVAEPARVDEVLARVREVGGPRHRDRRGHRHAPHADLPRRRAGRRHAGRRAGRRLPAVRPRAREARRSSCTRAPQRDARSGRRARATTLLALLASPNIASRRPLFEQYDCMVGSRTARRPEQADAAVLDARRRRGIGVSIDGNGRRVAADPYTGAVEAVLECAANLACVGAEPLGLTNCLNFGNPEKPHIAWQLTEAVRGLGDACRALGVPVVGGNVSLYNEGAEGPIYPTPVVGMVGELPDPSRAAAQRLRARGRRDRARRRLPRRRSPRASWRSCAASRCPTGCRRSTSTRSRATHAAVREAVRAGSVRSCHDIAEGGLAVALAECCLLGGIGATLDADGDERAVRRAAGRAPSSSRGRGERRRRRSGRVHRHRRRRRAARSARCSWSLDELRDAHGALAPLFP